MILAVSTIYQKINKFIDRDENTLSTNIKDAKVSKRRFKSPICGDN